LSIGLGRSFDLGSFGARVSGSANYSTVITSGGQQSFDNSSFGYSIRGSLSNGSGDGWSNLLDVSVSHGEIRISSGLITELEDVVVVADSIGAEDTYEARFSTSRTWRGYTLLADVTWRDRQSSEQVVGPPVQVETLTYTASLAGGKVAFGASGGESRVEQLVEQRVRFDGANLTYRPFPYLSIRTAYRRDDRAVVLGPDIKGERASAALEFRLGKFAFTAEAWQLTQLRTSGREQANRGYSLSIGRAFQGLLPIVSAPKRRGVIR
jgi:hypothetical protein